MPRALIRTLYLRLLGVIFLAAFLSAWVQVDALIGSQGLLPARDFFDAVRNAGAGWQVPSLFYFASSDSILRAAALAGAVLSFGLILDVAPRWCLLALWVLYLSFVHGGQDFFSFQWDNLLLEAGFFSLFVTPAGLHARGAPPPRPFGVFLLLWLVFRLHFESGAAKLLSGDPTWRDLTAMVSYYETAPLPTWVGWYAHQLPLWAQRATALVIFVIELGLPFLIWAPHRVRGVVFIVMVAAQAGIILTANYAFFNYLTIALCLFILDDNHLLSFRARRSAAIMAPTRPLEAAIASVLVALTIVPFTPWLPLPEALDAALYPTRALLAPTRSINAYHLFASMTLVRREAVLEGSDDGETWLAYDLRYKPGEVNEAPRFVAPHQPRLDFQLWFLLLRNGPAPRYFDQLLTRLLQGTPAVRGLFRVDPFPDHPPRFVRLAAYQYRFTDAEARRQTGAWWRRERLGETQPRHL